MTAAPTGPTGPTLTDLSASIDAIATRMPGPLGLAAAQIRAVLLRLWRSPEYVIGVVAVPIILYAMFGLPNAGELLPSGTDVGALMFASMTCYGLVSLAIFTFGADVAEERAAPWMRRMRSTPMPMWVYFVGKLAVGLLFSVLIIAGVWATARFGGHVQFDTGRLLRTCGVLLLGTLCFSTMGYAIAYWFTPKAASAIANLIFLPLAFLSGFFMPLSQLPEVVRGISSYLPTYHFGQLVWGQMANAPADIVRFGTPSSGSTLIDCLWVAGSFLVFGLLTVLGYRRDLERARS